MAPAAAAPGPGDGTRGTLGRGTLRRSSAAAAPVQPPRSVQRAATARPSSSPGSSNSGRSTPSEPPAATTVAGTHPPGRLSSSRAERTTGGIGCPYTPASPPVTEPKTDGRTHPRAPIELKVDYKKLNSFFADYTRNISKGGTFIKTRKPLPVGTRFLFKLSIPGRDEPFELLGEVAWSNADGDDAGMGIRFVYADDTQRFAFEDVVERLMSDSLGRELTRKLLNKAGAVRPAPSSSCALSFSAPRRNRCSRRLRCAPASDLTARAGTGRRRTGATSWSGTPSGARTG